MYKMKATIDKADLINNNLQGTKLEKIEVNEEINTNKYLDDLADFFTCMFRQANKGGVQ